MLFLIFKLFCLPFLKSDFLFIVLPQKVEDLTAVWTEPTTMYVLLCLEMCLNVCGYRVKCF